MPHPLDVFFTFSRLFGIVAAIAAVLYIVYDNLEQRKLRGKTKVVVVLEGKVDKKRVLEALKAQGFNLAEKRKKKKIAIRWPDSNGQI